MSAASGWGISSWRFPSFTSNILDAANAVIARNSGRREKRLFTESGAGAPITGYVADSEHDEARWISAEIDRLADEAGVRPRDVAVFYRTNSVDRKSVV